MTIEKLKIILFKINDSLRKILFYSFLGFLYKKHSLCNRGSVFNHYSSVVSASSSVGISALRDSFCIFDTSRIILEPKLE